MSHEAARSPASPDEPAPGEGGLLAIAGALDVAVPPACRAGVEANLQVLLRHVRIVLQAPDPPVDPAELLRP